MTTRLRAERPFIALLLVGFLGRLGYEMVRSPITSLFALSLGAPVEVIGLLVAGSTLSGIVVKLPAGALSDIFGFKRLIVTGSVVKATAPFLYLFVHAWQWLLPVRLYHGLATAIYAPAAAALVANKYIENRAQRLGIYSAAENAGIVFGPALGGFVLFITTFDNAFLIAGVIGIVALAVAYTVPSDRPKEEARSRAATTATTAASPAQQRPPIIPRLREGILEILRTPPILAGAMVEGTMFFGFGTLQAYLPLYAISIQLNTLQIGLLFAAQGTTSILGRPTLGRVSDRVGRVPLIVGGMVICAVPLALIPQTANFGLLLVLSALFGLGTGAVTPSTTSLIADQARARNYGAAMGVFGSIWDTGHASGPILSGLLIVAIGYQSTFLIIGAIMMIVLAPFLLIVVVRKKADTIHNGAGQL